MTETELDPQLAAETIATIRLLAVDAVEKASSGHPGTPMEAAPIAYLLYTRHLRHNPRNPDWPGRDRFILSCGHASMLLYGMLHLSGYDLSMEQIERFRQLGSATPGHPEFGHTPGVETTTGPLGQGFATGVGMAMGGQFLAEQIDEDLFGYRTYILCSDGDMMEGIASEAASLAGHLQLGNLIAVYLDNRITIEGETGLSFSEDVAARYRSYGWHVERVIGEDLIQVDAALSHARRESRPTLIIARTHIAEGSPTLRGMAATHGAPLGSEEVRLIKERLGRDPDEHFVVPEEVRLHMAGSVDRGAAMEARWSDRFDTLRRQPDSPLTPLLRMTEGHLPDGWADDLPCFKTEDGPLATRKASGIVLNALAVRLPLLLGGSADLAPSTNTLIKGEESFRPGRSGRNLHFGVREHAMGGILNGLAHTPGLLPYGATFLIFSDFMRPPMRLAAMMGLAPIYIFTHDSIGLGEDGPTHQPVEQLPGLRAVPGLTLIRPADANEVAVAWQVAVENRCGPTALILSRQGLPVLDRREMADATGLNRGGYVLVSETGPLRAILIASGSEVHPVLAAREELQKEGVGVRVVSLPSWEIFAAQSATYREEVLPAACTLRVAVEAAATLGWERYVGTQGAVIGMESFGASAPGKELAGHFGFTAEAIAGRVRSLLSR